VSTTLRRAVRWLRPGSGIVALVAGMFDNTPFRSDMFWLVWGAAAALSYRYARRAT
jgi:hypothetical protein